MKVWITPCCAEKSAAVAPLPALERYLAPRIKRVAEQAALAKRPFRVLSGRFGLLEATAEIPWYDYLLRAEDVPSLVPEVCQELQALEASGVIFFAPSCRSKSLEPYFAVLEHACAALAIPFELMATEADSGYQSRPASERRLPATG